MDPISGPIRDIAYFLSYRSIITYRSAISSTHDRLDGFLAKTPQPRPHYHKAYDRSGQLQTPLPMILSTWDVNVILGHIQKLGETTSLSLNELTLKTAVDGVN